MYFLRCKTLEKKIYTSALSHHFSCLQNTEKHRQHRCFSIIQCASSCAVDTGPEHLALATLARSAVPSESTSGPFINMDTRATISSSLNTAAHQMKMCGAHRDLIILPIGRPLEQKGKHVISFCLIPQTDTHTVPALYRRYAGATKLSEPELLILATAAQSYAWRCQQTLIFRAERSLSFRWQKAFSWR